MKKTASSLNKLATLFLMLGMGSLPAGARAESTWITDFSQFNEDDYYEGRNSYWDEDEENYVLTEPQGSLQGRIFYRQDFNMAIFTADFDIYIGGGDGSDGMTFAWVADYEYEGGGGGYLDFHNAEGFAVEFDTYPNREFNDPNEEHIGLLEDDVSNHLDSWQTNVGELDCDDWRHVTVSNFLGHIEVTWEDEVVIDYEIEDYEPFEGYFGFSAGTGGGVNYHRVDNVEIVVGGAEMALSREEMDFGPVTSGDRVEQDLTIYNVSEEEDAEWFSLEYSISDEGDAPDWLAVDDAAAEGRIVPGDSVVATFYAATEGVELGEYQRTIIIESNDPDHQRVEIPAHIFIVEGFGRLFGSVTDFADGQPLEGAVVAIERYGYSDTTDADGAYEFPRLPVWSYDVNVTRQDYLPHYEEGLEVSAGGDTQWDVALLHARFVAEPDAINQTLAPDSLLQLPLIITNAGNGPLTWMLDLAFPEGVETPPWELRRSLMIGDTVNDTRIGGAIYADGYYYVSGGEQDINWIYVLDREGALVRRFQQLGASNYGFADLDYDGENLWGATNRVVYKFNANGDSLTSFAVEARSPQGIAWDSDRQWVWLCEITGNLIGFDLQGQEQGMVRLHGYRIYGLAYWEDDPDGYGLYFFHDVNDTMAVSRANPESGDVEFVSYLYPESGGGPGGAFITRRYDPYSWVFVATANATAAEGGDRVDLWQLQANTGWVAVEPMAGMIDADADAELSVTLNTAGMLVAQYQVDLAFRHDGVGGADTVPLALEVIAGDTVPPPENHPPSAFNLVEPENGSYIGLWPGEMRGPNVTFTWEKSVDPDSGSVLSYDIYFVLLEPQGYPDSLSYPVGDTLFTIDLKDLAWDSLAGFDGDGSVIGWWVKALSAPDTIECNERFVINVDQPLSVGVDVPIPVIFGFYTVSPNPFNSRLLIDYGLDIAGESSVSIYDLFGREVAVLASGRRAAGRYRLAWDAAGAPSGVYLVRLTSRMRMEQRKVVLVK